MQSKSGHIDVLDVVSGEGVEGFLEFSAIPACPCMFKGM